MEKLRIVFMGTPDFAVPSLLALAEAGHEILAVYCQPPRPAGRGRKDRPSPVQLAAESKTWPVQHPKSLKTAEAQAAFADLAPDLAVVAAYGLILPQAVLDLPRYGCLNVHASLLPRWRGAAPIQRAILAGDTETGITIMQMDSGLDTGAMLRIRALAIGATEDAASLHDRLSALGAELLTEVAADFAAGRPPQPQAQDDASSTYAAKIDKSESRLDWREPAEVLARRVRAFTPWPGAWFDCAGERIKLRRAEALTVADAAPAKGAPGEILDDRLTVACGQGSLRLQELQRAGKGVMAADAFLRGFPLPKGNPPVMKTCRS